MGGDEERDVERVEVKGGCVLVFMGSSENIMVFGMLCHLLLLLWGMICLVRISWSVY